MNTGRSLDYTEVERDRHYAGTVKPEQCTVCLMGMGASHGHTEILPLLADRGPCPMYSAVTGQPCTLPEGHAQASPDRFHAYAPGPSGRPETEA